MTAKKCVSDTAKPKASKPKHKTKEKATSSATKKGGKQASLFDKAGKEKIIDLNPKQEVATYEMSLSPIIDKKSYDGFIRTISMRVYSEFDKNLRGMGITRPEVFLVGFDIAKATNDNEVRMANYVSINARLIMERAFIDPLDYARHYMPRVMREAELSGASSEMLSSLVESKVQRDIMMEIRAIAMQHIPDGERYNYINKLKEY
jgi:hypothetical protein